MSPSPRRVKFCSIVEAATEAAVIVALNLGAEPVSVTTSSIGNGCEILLSTFLDRQGEKMEGALDLRGNEGVIVGKRAQAG